MKIFVTSAFSVRFGLGEELRVFAPGAHELSEEEFNNWFVQGCIQEGRATILSRDVDETLRLKAELCSMSVPELKKMAMEMGIGAQDSPNKGQLIAAILELSRAQLSN